MRVIRVKRVKKVNSQNAPNSSNPLNPFNPPNIIVVTGQTSTGKTKLAYELAKKHHGELINFDSRQVYKKLDIITGKEVFHDVTTHLIDIVDPKEHFSSFDFANSAKHIINYLISHQITPVLVGGTYLYLKHLLYGIDTKVPADWKLREKLNKKSVEQLQEMLKDLSFQSFKRLNNSDRNNPHRLIRKIEIAIRHSKLDLESGEVEQILNQSQTLLTQVQDDTQPHRHPGASVASDRILKVDSITSFQNDKNGIKITGLRFKDSRQLKLSITKRVEQRVRNGAFQEVKHLIKQGYKSTDPGMQTIGYKQLMQYYSGMISRDEALQQWITKETQYAKRQYTFMKKDKNIHWKIV